MVRPTLADAVLKMPRGAQVIYPKDLGAILIEADIAPGMRVLEAGVGSGALSMALLRAGADVVGYELREDFADRARANVEAMLGSRRPLPGRAARRLRGHRGARVSTGSCSTCPSRGGCCPTPTEALRPGGILLRLPADHQPDRPAAAAMDTAGFGMASTLEVLHRTWHIEDRSVRPDHRMVGHTGFLTTARLLCPVEDQAGTAPPTG